MVNMDNASFHKYPRIRGIIENASHHLLDLPPYSPDFNLIKHDWTWLKNELSDL
jgi:transposase